jgi:uncharacterized protein YndB with AHSA1/START domain
MKLRDEKLRDESVPWVERETMVEASPEEVWEALTDEDRLAEWLAPDVELDPFEGGEISVGDGADRRTGTVETMEESERFAFTWSRPGEGESFVEFTLEPLPAGTRVRVVETPIGPTGSTVGGWSPKLSRLERSLRLMPVA